MLRITLSLLVGALVWGFASCSIICPDGTVCSDLNTCCKTYSGYGCCSYPNAVCCSDLAHCCPSGYRCNLAMQTCEKKSEPWVRIPMVKKEVAEEPNVDDRSAASVQEVQNNQVSVQTKSSVVYCDSYYYCPDGSTCCRHPQGPWICCPLSPRPMMALTKGSSSPSDVGVIRCNSGFYCQAGQSCCKGSSGQWSCCPYPLGTCCGDGQHCCQYGYTCDATSKTCRRLF
ncbi:progranulin-like isoform 1-T1 [Pholidichthys leucotaenia]